MYRRDDGGTFARIREALCFKVWGKGRLCARSREDDVWGGGGIQ